MSRTYEEIVEFMAERAPEIVAEFRPSEEVRQRLRDLMARLKDEPLSADESNELDGYMRLESIMRIAKARAR